MKNKKSLFVALMMVMLPLSNEYFGSSSVSIGYDVTSSIPYGNVSIEQGATLIVDKTSGVTIKNGFECKNGAEFVVQ